MRNLTGLGAKLCCRAVVCPVLLLMGCSHRCALSCSYLWLTIVYNVTYTVALYGLLLFYLVSVCLSCSPFQHAKRRPHDVEIPGDAAVGCCAPAELCCW